MVLSSQMLTKVHDATAAGCIENNLYWEYVAGFTVISANMVVISISSVFQSVAKQQVSVSKKHQIIILYCLTAGLGIGLGRQYDDYNDTNHFLSHT
jgi:hypothetical protein